MTEVTTRLRERAKQLGFSMVGVVPAAPARRLGAYLRWLDRGHHGTMTYLARQDRLVRRQDPQTILPGLRSLVCVGLNYATLAVPAAIASDPSRGRISNYAWGTDYHHLMLPRLESLATWLEAEIGSPVASRAYVDTGAILERDHAESAGLGFVGKNTMLISPRHGSWFFLGELLTTAELPSDAPAIPMPTCGTCRRCLGACPTAAFPEPYVLDARRCISYLTIELKGPIPRDLRAQVGNWIYGCDICQEVCPFNRFAFQSAEPSFFPAGMEDATPPLLSLLQLGQEEFAHRFAASPIRRVKWSRFMRNVCVAAGNWGSPAAAPPLSELLAADEPLVRSHAAWALGQIGGRLPPAFVTGLEKALSVESEDEVREEIAVALDGLGRT